MIVSFIIPAYNAAETIGRCLDSIYSLSLKREEFEVIVVDDCSTDKTVEVVEAYRQQVYGVQCTVYDNITLLCQPKNNRQGAARNRGVSVAKGEYICFVDSDDAVTEGIVSAIRLAKEQNTDMTVFHHGFANEHGVITAEADKLSFKEKKVFSGVEMQNKHAYWCSAPWGYIYKTAFLQKVNYPFAEGALYEDSDFVAVHLYYAQRMTYSPELGYLTYEREGSTTRSMNHKNVADYLLLGTRMLALYESIAKSQEPRVKSQELEQFAEGILEGACWNIERAFHYLPRLTFQERKACYERIDAHVDRKALLNNPHLRKYYWRTWTKIGLSAPSLMKCMSAIVAPLYWIKNRLR